MGSDSIVSISWGIEKVQVPYSELCLDENVFGGEAYYSTDANHIWNLPFDIVQNKQFFN